MRTSLQIANAILGLIPIVTGIVGMFGIGDPLYQNDHLPRSVLLDTNLRFFAGFWLGAGLALCWLIPQIEKQTVLFRALWGMIFAGGVGRLISMLALGLPPAPFIAFTLLEIAGAPIMIFWHSRVIARSGYHQQVSSGLVP